MANQVTTEALTFACRGVGLVHNHPVSSTSRTGEDLWSRSALLLLQCRWEMGSQDHGVLWGRAERHQRRSQLLGRGRTRGILVADDAIKSLLLSIHQFCKCFPASVRVGLMP